MKMINISTKKYPNTFVRVDDEDFEWLNQWKWYYFAYGGYAIRAVYDLNLKKNHRAWMHRVIMSTPKGMQTDHINGDGLDNRRSNLRICTQIQNSQNRSPKSDNSSGYSGVHWAKKGKKWCAYIDINKKRTNLGRYKNIQGAWLARRFGERIYFKEFRRKYQ